MELDPLITASDLEKSDLGKNRFYSALNMPYLKGKIIGAERVRSFIGYSGWPITLQLPLDTLAFLCKLIADWPSGPVVVWPGWLPFRLTIHQLCTNFL